MHPHPERPASPPHASYPEHPASPAYPYGEHPASPAHPAYADHLASPARHPGGMDPVTAVLIGHVWVTGPCLAIIAAGAFVGWWIFGIAGALMAFPQAIAPAWLWWSFFVPRWRRWAHRKGADPDATQEMAAVTGLVWPKGFFLEKTEFRLKD